MDIHELKYFVQVAEEASYSAAAAKLYISQPALSKVIQKAENEIGYKLFYTDQRQQKLTDTGKKLYEKAVQVIAEYDDIGMFMQKGETGFEGQVYLGFPDVAGTCYFCELIAEFTKCYPNIKLHIREGGAQKIMANVESGILDVGCAVMPVPEDRFDWWPFVRDISHLVVSTRHPLAQKQSITLPELKDESFVLLGTEFSTHHDICTALREAGFEPNIVMLSSQWDFIIQMVRMNYGISFLPQSLFQRFFYPDIHLLEVDHLMKFEDLVLITKKGRYLSRNAKCLIDFITQRMAEKKADIGESG